MLKGLTRSISVRLIGAFGFIAIIALAGAFISYAQITRINNILVYETTEKAEARYLATKIRGEILQITARVEGYVRTESTEERTRLATQFTDDLLVFEEFVNQLEEQVIEGQDEEELSQFEALRPLYQEYIAAAQGVLVTYGTEGELGEQTQVAMERFQQSQARVLDSLDAFENLETSKLYASQRVARTAVERALLVTIIGGGTVVVGGILLGWAISRTITQPVGKLVAAARRIASGDLENLPDVRSRTEIGVLARVFNEMAVRLRDLIAGLEQRVEERTRVLEQRTRYLEASADVGRAASSILEERELIRRAVELIRARFGLYYVGLFLKDEAGEWAVLRAGTGEAGRAMLARGHRIRIGTGMIGWSIAHNEARVAHDVGEDAVRLTTEELPETRSEAALPLQSRGRVIGALTVQSERPAAFDESTIAVLQLMADQVAVALDNARLFAETQEALEATSRAYGEMSRQTWEKLLRTRTDIGYRIDEAGVLSSEMVDSQRWRPEVQRAWRTGQTVPGEKKEAGEQTLALPVRVRGTVIGVLDVSKPGPGGAWTRGEINQLEMLADQLGVALDNARLYEESRRRAGREQLISDITARVRSSMDLETILQTAIRELGVALGTDRAFVQLVGAPEGEGDRGDGGDAEEVEG